VFLQSLSAIIPVSRCTDGALPYTPVWSWGHLLVSKRMPTSGSEPYGYTKGVPLLKPSGL